MFHERFLPSSVTNVVGFEGGMHYLCTRQTNRTSDSELLRTSDERNRFRGELMHFCVRRAVKHFPHRLDNRGRSPWEESRVRPNVLPRRSIPLQK